MLIIGHTFYPDSGPFPLLTTLFSSQPIPRQSPISPTPRFTEPTALLPKPLPYYPTTCPFTQPTELVSSQPLF